MATVANVTLSDTNDLQRIKINQVIKIVNDVETLTHPLANIAGVAANTANATANSAANIAYDLITSNTEFMLEIAADSANIAANIILSNSATQNILNAVAADYIDDYLANVNFTTISNSTNLAYLQANTARGQANTAYTQANLVFNAANASFAVANTANVRSNLSYIQANTGTTIAVAAFAKANTGIDIQSNIIFGVSNAAYSQANTSYTQANLVFGRVNSAFGHANTGFGVANNSFGKANIAHLQANTGTTIAVAAFAKANTASEFVSGTRLIFPQNAAPTGWTKDTTNYNDHALRVVTGPAGTTGGTVNFSTAMVNQSVSASVVFSGALGSTTLTTNQIPSHHHDITTIGGSFSGSAPIWDQSNQGSTNFGTVTSENTGGGSSHTHSLGTLAGSISDSIDLRVKYLNVITATKD